MPKVKEFKPLRVMFMSEGKMKHKINTQMGASSPVMQWIHRSVVLICCRKEGDEKLTP